MTNATDASYNEKLSYGLLMSRGELTALRVLAARRGMAVSQLIRETMRPLVDEAYRLFEKGLPPRPTERS